MKRTLSWEVVYRAQTVSEAESVRLKLFSAGLHARVWDSHLAGLNPWLTPALGGIRVVVPEDQVEEAKHLIAMHDKEYKQSEVSEDELERLALHASLPEEPKQAPKKRKAISTENMVLVLMVVVMAIVALIGLMRMW